MQEQFSRIEIAGQGAGITYLGLDLAGLAYDARSDFAPCSELTSRVQTGAVPQKAQLRQLSAAGVENVFGLLVEERVQVEIRGQGVKAQVVPTPFYRRKRS